MSLVAFDILFSVITYHVFKIFEFDSSRREKVKICLLLLTLRGGLFTMNFLVYFCDEVILPLKQSNMALV